MSGSTDPKDACGCSKTSDSPPAIYNRPGLPSLSYRLRTHASALQAMKYALSRARLEIPLHELDDHGVHKIRQVAPLSYLTTRAEDDAGIALLDAWAVVTDVLTFYQERIANEGFLRTATERFSVLTLARAIGYELNPGVAASTYLAFTVESAAGAPEEVTVKSGTKVLSIPGQDEQPQNFETIETIIARAEWNRLIPCQRDDQPIMRGLQGIFLRGINTQLKPGDYILLVGKHRENFGGSEVWDIRIVQTVTAYPSSTAEESYTHVAWDEGLGHDQTPIVDPANPAKVYAFRQRAALFGHNAPDFRVMPDSVKASFDAKYNPENPSARTEWPGFVLKVTTENEIDLDCTYPKILAQSWVALIKPRYTELYKVLNADTASRTDYTLTSQVTRIQLDTLEHLGWFGLRETVVLAQSEQLDLFEKPIAAPVCGDRIELSALAPGLRAGQALAVSGRRICLEIASDARSLNLTDDVGSFQTSLMPGDVLQVMAAPIQPATLAAETRVLMPSEIADLLDKDSDQEIQWYLMDRNGTSGYLKAPARCVALHAASEEDEMLTEIAFIDSGEDAVASSRDRTTLVLRKPLANCYDRTTVWINANVAAATHGETILKEALGSGDGSIPNQKFALKKPPLTYTPAAAASGGKSTLDLSVNGVKWSEAFSLCNLGALDHSYIVRIDKDAKPTVVFGDGMQGARLPSGSENVVATYRSGIGEAGNLEAGKLSLLKTRPLGIRSVTNPVPAKGGVEPEDLEEARNNAPMKVLTLDRIVSLRDFENFAQAFSGIGKAQALSLWNGTHFFVNITAATSEEEPIDPKSDLYANLLDAINAGRDPFQPVVISGYVSRTFSLSAGLILDDACEEANVIDESRSALMEAFSFSLRAFGQIVTAAEIITLIQSVPGVIAVDLDSLVLDGAGSPSSPASSSQKPAAMLTAQQAGFDLQNRRIIPAELLLISEQGIRLFKKGKSS